MTIDSAQPSDLSSDEQRLLDEVVAQQLARSETISLEHVLLCHPPEEEQRIRTTLSRLAKRQLILVGGYPTQPTLHLTPTGLLASSSRERVTRTIELLLSLFKRQLREHGADFVRYSFADLCTEQGLQSPEDFPLFQTVVQVFLLHHGGSGGPGPPPTATWTRPTDISAFRSFAGADAVLARVRRVQQQADDATHALIDALDPEEQYSMQPQPDKSLVFVIHGRNSAAKLAMDLFLQSLGLKTLDFDDVANTLGGTPFVGDIVREGIRRAHGIISLFTPDEEATLRREFHGPHDKPEDLQRWQARPNVLFEAGMAYATQPERTILVTLGANVSLFSDVGGVHTIRLANDTGSRGRLRNRLAGIHCAVDLHTNKWADHRVAGDFEACFVSHSQMNEAVLGTSSQPSGLQTPTVVSEADARMLLEAWIAERPEVPEKTFRFHDIDVDLGLLIGTSKQLLPQVMRGNTDWKFEPADGVFKLRLPSVPGNFSSERRRGW